MQERVLGPTLEVSALGLGCSGHERGIRAAG
jgi:hypothetical protein